MYVRVQFFSMSLFPENFTEKKSIFLMMALFNEACKLFFDDNPCMENEFALENDKKVETNLTTGTRKL